jgi:non-heme chloroperoxidase
MSAPAAPTVVFVHGLWMHATSWDGWINMFTDAGYAAIAPAWPGEAATVEETRRDPDAMAGVGVAEVVDRYAAVIADLPEKPIVIGHSFGGLVVQQLLGAGLASGCVALCPAQFRGVLRLPFRELRSAWPVLSRPGLRKKTWAHTAESYHRNFANGVDKEESDAVFEKYVIPAPGRPLFQAGLANVTTAKASTTVVDRHMDRGPLLMIAGGADRTAPQSVVRAAYNKQWKNAGVTEFLAFPGRGHSLPADSGWRDVAAASLEFLARNGLAPSTTPHLTAT